MRSEKTNSIFKAIIALISSVVIFVFIIWKFISTDTFGKYLSEYINKYIKQYTEVSIQYEKLEVKLFPPGIRVKQLAIKSIKPLGDVSFLSANIKQMDFDAKLFTFNFDKLQMSNIELDGVDLVINIDLEKKNKKNNEFDFWSYWKYDFLNNLLIKGPVEVFRVGFKNVNIRSNLFSGEISTIAWEKFREKMNFDLDLKNINTKSELLSYLKQQQFNLDLPPITQIQLNSQILKNKITITKFKLNVENQEITSRVIIQNPFEKDSFKYVAESNLNLGLDLQQDSQTKKIKEVLNKFGFSSLESKSELKLTGDLKKIVIAGKSLGTKVVSKYGDYNSLKVEWLVENDQLAISKIEIEDKKSGKANTNNMDILIDLKNLRIKNFAAEVSAEKLDFSNAIAFIPSVSKSLRGYVSGEFLTRWDDSKKSVNIFTSGKPQIKNFSLLTSNNKEILKAEEVYLPYAKFEIGASFNFEGELNWASNVIKFNGLIDKEKIKIDTNEFIINFNDIKYIAGISVEGKGPVSISAEGDLKNPQLKFNLKKIQHANIFGFYLGELDAGIIIDFNRNAIFLENIAGKLNPGELKGDGYISLEDFTSDLSIKAIGLSSYDILAVHKSLLPWNLSFLEKAISSTSINYKISGKINSLALLQVKADLLTQRFTLGSEEIFDLRASLLLKDKILSMPDISFKKGKGTFTMGLSSDFNENVFRIAFKTKNLEASDLFFYNYIKPSFSSAMQIEGAYKSTKTSSEGVLNVISTKARLNDEIIDDSYLAFQWKDGVAKLQARYAENWVKINSQIDFKQSIHDAANKSYVTASVNVPNWGKILSLVASFDNDDPVLNGKLNLELDSLFNVNRIRQADVDFWIKSLSLTHPSLQINKTENDRITIQNGEIKKWNIKIKGIGRDQIISRAYGNINTSAEIESIFDFSLAKLNYFLGSYVDLNGFIQSQLKIRLAQNSYNYLGKIKSEDTVLNTKSLVTTLGKTKFELEFDNKETRLVNWQSQMGSGYLNATGNINWSKALYPSVTFRYGLNNAKIQIATRSMSILNGQGLLVGTQPPYMINGDIKLTQTEIFNEPSDFEFNNTAKQGTVRHLPTQIKQNKNDLFLFNLQLSTESPIMIRNSIAELNLLANLNLQSKISDPRLSGQVSMKTDRKNIFILKNNQFKINRLNLVFDQRQIISNPTIDIDAESPISNYIVRAKVYGSVKNYQLDLNSDPVLQRQSILSLIAFGYADNVSQNMSNQDREALSSAGLGAFIFDQLKLNERLHSNLGLTLNVGTEYLNTSNSLLQGRTQQSTGAVVGQIRTATKLELRKKIDEKVGLSVSSTVGGSAGQKQSMNLNYLVNRNISLDALYEVNSDVSDNQERAGRSAGGDVKFRWTFK